MKHILLVAKNGFVIETVVTTGKVRDRVSVDEVYGKVTEHFPEAEVVVADAAYKTPHICKKIFDNGRFLYTTHKRPQAIKGGGSMFAMNSMIVRYVLNTSR